MNLDDLKETLLKAALNHPHEGSHETISLLLRHWSVEVPSIFRPSVDLNPVYDEKACIENLITPLEWFITGIEKPKELLERLKNVCPPPDLCGKVFKGGEPVYNCRDCGMDGTCVLCVDCFKNSQHKNHRYRICPSSSGYCDCGDKEAWTEHPTCKLHDKTLNNNAFVSLLGNIMTSIEFEQLLARLKLVFQFVLDYCYILLKWSDVELPVELQVPEDLKLTSKAAKLVAEGNQYLSVLYNDETHTYEHVIHALNKAIRCDTKLATDYATAVDREGRCIICLDNVNKCGQVATQIADITKKSSDKKLEVKVCHADVFAHQTFAIRLINWMSSILPICEQFRTIFASHLFKSKHFSEIIRFVNDDVVAVSLVEKLMLSDTFFWKSIRVLWHQLFMSGLLLEMETKRQYSRLFTRNYVSCIKDYMKDDHEHRVSILCLSVQIFTVPSIVHWLVEQENVIELLLNAFIEVNQRFHVATGKFKFDIHQNQLVPFRRSFQILGDVSYILAKPPQAWNDRLRQAFGAGVEAFVKLIKRVQLMDSIVRQVNQHIEYEPGWETGISLQMKLAPLSKSMIDWCISDEKVYLGALRSALEWFRYSFSSSNRNTRQIQQHAVGHSAYCWDYDVSRREVSIHMPLIRFIGGLLVHSPKFGVHYVEDARLPTDRPAPECLIELPLRTLVMVSQFRAGMWRRNGYSLINQVLFYFNVRLREEMFDRDLVLLQVGASLMDANEFLIHMLNKFNLMFLVDEGSLHKRPTNDEMIRQTNTVIEEFFRLFYMILVERYVPGLGAVTLNECIKQEAIQWLCKESMSNSDLQSHLSSEDAEVNVEELILEVADFVRSANPMKHGKYVLKEKHYKDFNPFFYHYNRTDQSTSIEAQLGRLRSSKAKYICCPPPRLPDWVPSFKAINNLLISDVLLSLVKTILEKTCDLNDNLFSETQFQQVLYICGIALQEEEKRPTEFKFSAKCIDYGIVELLERCNSRHILPRIEMHKDMLTWLFDKFTAVFQSPAQSDQPMDTAAVVSAAVASAAVEPTAAPVLPSSEQQREEEARKAKRREMANARKNRILEQMNAMQKTFMDENSEYFKEGAEASGKTTESGKADSMMDVSTPSPATSGVAIGVNQDPRLSSTASFVETDFSTCILCLEQHNINSNDRFLVLGAFFQKSTVLSQNRSHKSWIMGGARASKMPFTVKDAEGNLLFVESDLNYGPHVNTCTHYMHSDCFTKYLNMIENQERRRVNGRHPRLGYDISKGEFLCPLCECLCNIAIPIMPRVAIKPNSIKTDIPMEKFLSGLHSIVTESGCDGSSGWLDSRKYSETYSGHKKPFIELIQLLPFDIRQYFQDLHTEYMSNTQPDVEGCPRKRLVVECTKTAYARIFGRHQEEALISDVPDAMQSICWSVAYSIHTIERLLRTGRTCYSDMIDNRSYHCMKALIAMIRSQTCTYSYSVPRKQFLFLSNYLLVQAFYQSSPFSILDVDAFSLLVSLLSTSQSLFSQEQDSGDADKFTVVLGNSVDKNLIELMFTFHLVQIILTNANSFHEPPTGQEPMDVDDGGWTASSSPSSGDQNLIPFIIDVLTAAGHHFTSAAITANPARLTALIRSKMLPFLRCVAVFAHFLTDVALPKRLLAGQSTSKSTTNSKSTTVISQSEEYDELCHYLGVPSNFSVLGITYLRGVALFWPRHSRIGNMFASESGSQQSPSRTTLKAEFAHVVSTSPGEHTSTVAA